MKKKIRLNILVGVVGWSNLITDEDLCFEFIWVASPLAVFSEHDPRGGKDVDVEVERVSLFEGR